LGGDKINILQVIITFTFLEFDLSYKPYSRIPFYKPRLKRNLKSHIFILLASFLGISSVFANIPTGPLEDLLAKGNPKVALAEIEKQKKDLNPIDYVIMKSSALIMAKNWKDAIDILEPAYKNDPKNAVVANNYAAALWGSGKKDAAKKILENTLLTTSPAFRNLRKIYAVQAAESYSKALDGKSSSPSVELYATAKNGLDLEDKTSGQSVPPKIVAITPPPPIEPSVKASTVKPVEELAEKDDSSKRADKPVETKDSRDSKNPDFVLVEKNIRDWANAWSNKNVKAYLAFYSNNFSPDGGLSYGDWVEQRRQRVSKPGEIKVQAEILNVSYAGKKIVVSIRQRYTSVNLKTNSVKYIEWANEQGKWVITRESNNR